MVDFVNSRIHNVGNTGVFNTAMNRNIFTPQALNAFRGIAASPLGTVGRSVLGIPGAVAATPFLARAGINYLTERDPNATRSSLFNIDLTRNANEGAALPGSTVDGWGSPMGIVPDGGVVPPIKKINTPLNDLDPNWQHQLRMQDIDRGNIDNRFSLPNFGVSGILKGLKDQFTYRGAQGEVWDPTTGQMLSAEEQDEQNALGGYYSDAARHDRAQRARVTKMLARQKAGKRISQMNLDRLIDQGYGPKITPPVVTAQGDQVNTGGKQSGWDSPGYTTQGGFTGTRSAPSARGTTTPASGRGHHSWAQGGRIGYNRGRVVNPGGYNGKPDWEIQQINEFGVSYPEFLDNQGFPPLNQMSISEIAAAASAWDKWKRTQNAQGGRIGLRTGGDPDEIHDDLSTFEFMQDQGVPFGPMAEGEEDPLSMLIAQYIEQGFSPEDAEKMALEQFELMAQGSEQGQGLASLV